MGRFVNPDNPEVVLASQTTITDKNLYAYCDNNPVMRVDGQGNFWDVVLDVVSVAVSIADVVSNPKSTSAWLSLGADVACMMLPCLTGGGSAVRSVAKSDDTADALKTIKNAASKLNKGDNTVYVAYKGKTLEYVGITNDFSRRQKEWEGVRNIKEFVTGVDREGARFIEQAVIDTFGMSKNGGVLSNKINSIGVKNPIYLKYKEFYTEMWK